MVLVDESLQESVIAIWATMLDLEARPIARVPAAEVTRGLTGCVQITGAWKGALTLNCPAPLARRLAGVLFDMGEDELDDTLVYDALGELTNILGGNYKSLLPEPCELSLPAVTSGTDYTLHVVDSRPMARLAFLCRDQPFVVSVLEGSR